VPQAPTNDVSCEFSCVCQPTNDVYTAQDDPVVEYEDEFGRVRTARRSEVPRNLVLNREDEVDEDE